MQTVKDKKSIPLEPSERRADIDQLRAHSIIWSIFRPLLVVLISVSIVLFGCNYAYNYVVGHYIAPVDVTDTTPVMLEIESGSSLKKISELLEKNKLIRSASVFKYYTDFSDRSSKLKSGTFMLNKSMTMDEIIREMSRGTESRQEVTVVFIEGITIDEMALRLEEKGVIKDRESFRKACEWDPKYAEYSVFLDDVVGNEKNENRRYLLEGYLAPDTYRFFKDTSDDDVIKRLLEQFDNVVKLEWEDRAEELGMTIDQVIALASIIEKEGRGKDFTKISAVFHNRLAKDMRLDSDASVNYAVRGRKLVISDSDLKIDSPYNTRKYKGFPLGPICNPGKAAIQAALYPDEECMAEGNLFFLLTDPQTGEVLYSKTQKEHDKLVAQWKPVWQEYDRQNR